MSPQPLPPDLVQWLFPPSALYHTPSMADNYTLHAERLERARGIEFMFRVGLQLGMHQHAMSAAAVYFHRFYMRYSLIDYHRLEIAATCLFLAGKVEENGRKLNDVAGAVVLKLHKSQAPVRASEILATHDKEVKRFEQLITVYELLLCDALCFDLEISHPQGHLVIALGELRAPDTVSEVAWTIGNDALYTPLCVLHPPNIIAAACYTLAQQLLLPEETLDERLLEEFESIRWREAWGVQSEEDLGRVRDSVTLILEFWRSLDDESRRVFNTKIEDVPSQISSIALPTSGRTLASYAPQPTSPKTPYTNGRANRGSSTPAANGGTGSGGGSTPWMSFGSGNGTPATLEKENGVDTLVADIEVVEETKLRIDTVDVNVAEPGLVSPVSAYSA